MSAAETTVPRTGSGRWVALVVVLVASFMQLLDGTITNVAIPLIKRDLQATDAQIQFVLAAYLLAYAALLITGGRIGDIIGRKRSFMIGMVGFILASILCGLCQSGLQLDLARGLQGITAALMLPQVLAVMQVLFPPGSHPGDRAKAFGLYGLTLGLPTLLGPFVGGGILQANLGGLGWRPIFLVNVPIGIAVLLLAPRFLPESKATGKVRLDLVGVVLIAVALVLLVGVLVQGRQAGWPAWAWIGGVLAIAALVAFWWWESRLTEQQRSPLLPMTLFHDRAFSVGLLITLVVFAGFTPLVFFFSIYLQLGVGYSPLAAGITTVPFAVGSMITSIASAMLAPKLGRTLLTLGAAVVCVGMAALAVTIGFAAVPLASGWLVAPALLIAGLGLGMLVGPLVNVILGASKSADAGAASGVLNNVNIVAGAVGVALFGVIFFSAAGGGTALAYTSAVRLTIISTLVAFAIVLVLTFALPQPARTPVANVGRTPEGSHS
ncbi:MFS transporter [Fodinicola feengrottensis]|uniref:MFS transporter n=1 Tax=Fodinicola feengrottensis TaxID=435914 RepID=A0ABN2IYE4_9ACTN